MTFFWRLGQSWGCDERLAALLDVEVVKEGIEVVLGGEACIEQEAFDARAFSEAPIVEHLQVVVNALMINTCFRLKRTKLG